MDIEKENPKNVLEKKKEVENLAEKDAEERQKKERQTEREEKQRERKEKQREEDNGRKNTR